MAMKNMTAEELTDVVRASLRIPLDHTMDTRPNDPLIALIPDGERVDDATLALAEQVVGAPITGMPSFDEDRTYRPIAARVRAQLRRAVRRLDH